ncbi:GDP-L-fucose synthase, partial [Streptomyces bacillaris]
MTTELPVPPQESARPLLRPGSRIFVAGHRGLVGSAVAPRRAPAGPPGHTPRRAPHAQRRGARPP